MRQHRYRERRFVIAPHTLVIASRDAKHIVPWAQRIVIGHPPCIRFYPILIEIAHSIPKAHPLRGPETQAGVMEFTLPSSGWNRDRKRRLDLLLANHRLHLLGF